MTGGVLEQATKKNSANKKNGFFSKNTKSSSYPYKNHGDF